MSAPEKTLYDEIQEIRARYPVSRSATLPALRLAQERYGWLSPEAFREVAEALERDAGLLHGGRVLLRHVPPGAGRDAPRRGLHERLLRARRGAAGARGVPGRARHPRGRDDRGRRGHAAHDRVRRRLRLGHGRRDRPPLPRAPSPPRTCPGSSRSSAAMAAEQFVVLAGAEEQPLLTARRLPRGGRLRRARDGAADGAGGRRPGDPRLGPARPRRRLLPDRPQGELPRQGHRQADVPRRQRGRVRAGHVQGPRDHVHASRTG